MRRLFSILLLFVTLRVFGAAGDVVSCAVRTDGWSVNLAFSGMDTNGTWSSGLGTDNVITGNEKLVFTVWSPGYDSTGTSNWNQRTVYGTKQVRFAYPNEAFTDQVLSNPDFTLGNVTNRFALSQPIYHADVVSNIIVRAGLYTKTVGNSANSSLVVVNNSALTYYYPFIFPTLPPWQLITGNTMNIHCMGWHDQFQSFRPFVCVEAVWTDQHSHTLTNVVTSMSIDRMLPDPVPTGEFIVPCDITTATQEDQLTVVVRGYPFIGTNVATYTITNKCNNAGTFPVVDALVDPVSGDNSTGVAVVGPLNTASPPAAFLTIGAAALAITKTNAILNSRSNVSACTLFIKAGLVINEDLTTKVGTNNHVWFTVTNFPGATVVLSEDVGAGFAAASRTRWAGMVISNNTTALFNAQPWLWLDRCILKKSGGAFTWWNGTRGFATWNTILSSYTGLGFRPAQPASIIGDWQLVRGNSTVVPVEADRQCHIGNVGQFIPYAPTTAGAVTPYSDPFLVYDNKVLGYTNNGPWFSIASNRLGGAVIQNLVECPTQPVSGGILSLGNSVSHQGNTNVDHYANTLVGWRCNTWYNSPSIGNPFVHGCSFNGNIFESVAWKTDTTTPFGDSFTNNWAFCWNVNGGGNWIMNAIGNTFWPDFNGLNSHLDTGTDVSALKFVRNAGFWGTGAGNGDYHLLIDSPVKTLKQRVGLRYDMDGVERNNLGAPGVYISPRLTYLTSGGSTLTTSGGTTVTTP